MKKHTQNELITKLFSIILFSVYIAFILIGRCFLYMQTEYLYKSALILFALFLLFGFFIYRFLRILPCRFKLYLKEVIHPPKVFYLSSIITFLFQLIYLKAYFPGGSSPDTVNQFKQTITNTYNDWHPYLHTIIFFKIPTFFGENITNIVLFQIIFYSLVVGYALATLGKYKAPIWFLILSFSYLCFNPLISQIILMPWKDVAFAFFALLCVTITVNVVCTDGLWLNKPINILFFAFCFVLSTFMRHNGVLYVLPLFLYLFFRFKPERKNFYKIITCGILLIIIFKLLLYNYLNVSDATGRVGEVVGLPLSMISGTASENYDELTTEVQEFLSMIISQEDIESKFNRTWNSLKWTGINRDPIEEVGISEILEYTFMTFVDFPIEMLKIFFDVTEMVWHPMKDSLVYVQQNDYFSINYADPNIDLQQKLKIPVDFLKELNQIIPIGSVFFSIGFWMLILLSYVIWQKESFWINFTLILPIFVYNYGTGLLLSGFDYRFFCYNFFVLPSTIFLLLWERRVEEN